MSDDESPSKILVHNAFRKLGMQSLLDGASGHGASRHGANDHGNVALYDVDDEGNYQRIVGGRPFPPSLLRTSRHVNGTTGHAPSVTEKETSKLPAKAKKLKKKTFSRAQDPYACFLPAAKMLPPRKVESQKLDPNDALDLVFDPAPSHIFRDNKKRDPLGLRVNDSSLNFTAHGTRLQRLDRDGMKPRVSRTRAATAGDSKEVKPPARDLDRSRHDTAHAGLAKASLPNSQRLSQAQAQDEEDEENDSDSGATFADDGFALLKTQEYSSADESASSDDETPLPRRRRAFTTSFVNARAQGRSERKRKESSASLSARQAKKKAPNHGIQLQEGGNGWPQIDPREFRAAAIQFCDEVESAVEKLKSALVGLPSHSNSPARPRLSSVSFVEPGVSERPASVVSSHVQPTAYSHVQPEPVWNPSSGGYGYHVQPAYHPYHHQYPYHSYDAAPQGPPSAPYPSSYTAPHGPPSAPYPSSYYPYPYAPESFQVDRRPAMAPRADYNSSDDRDPPRGHIV